MTQKKGSGSPPGEDQGDDQKFNRAPLDVHGCPIDIDDPDYMEKVAAAEYAQRIAGGSGTSLIFRLKTCRTLQQKAALIPEFLDTEYRTLREYPRIQVILRELKHIENTPAEKTPAPISYKGYKKLTPLLGELVKQEGGDKYGKGPKLFGRLIKLLERNGLMATSPEETAGKSPYRSI